MASDRAPLLAPGRVIEVSFPDFTARATIRSDRELTVEVIAGEAGARTRVRVKPAS